MAWRKGLHRQTHLDLFSIQQCSKTRTNNSKIEWLAIEMLNGPVGYMITMYQELSGVD